MKRVMLLGVESEYGHGVVTGIDTYCREHDRWEYYFGRDNSPEMINQATAVLQDWQPAGIVAHIQSERMERFVMGSGLPVVNVTGSMPRPVPTVICDNYEMGRISAHYFLGKGFRHFAYVALTPEISVGQRCAGAVDVLAKAGLACQVFQWKYTGMRDSHWATNRQRLMGWIRKLKKPTAMICAYDPLAQMVSSTCRQLGFQIPDEIAILGAGNDEFYCQLSRPQISSVDQNTARIGYEAARLLDRLMRGRKPRVKTILVPPGRVVTRESTDVVKIEHPDVAAAVRYIRDHAHEPISVKNLLDEIPLSRRLLEIRFLEAIGRTPSAELKSVRLKRAKKLLFESDMPVPAVARNSGFSSSRGFLSTFKRMTGQTPTDYRRKSRMGRPAHASA